MADSTVTGFPAGTALTGSEYFGCDQAGATNRVTANMLRTFVLTTPSITGNLAVTGSITGGSINSTPIGATTPSTGTFTSLSSSVSLTATKATSDLTISNRIAEFSNSATSTGLSLSAHYDGAGAGGDIIARGYAGTMGDFRVIGVNGSYLSPQQYAAFSANGLAVTGNISSTARTLVGTTTDDGVNALQVNGSVKASGISTLNGLKVAAASGLPTLSIDNSTDSGNVDFATGGSVRFRIGYSGTALVLSSPFSSKTIFTGDRDSGLLTVGNGLAVTGNISSTGAIAVSAPNAIYYATGTTGWSGYAATKTGGSILFAIDDGGTFGKLDGDGILRVTSGKTLHITDAGNVTRAAISPAGLAVTGNISTTGRALVGTTTDDGVNALQVNGAGIFAGLIKPQQATTAGAPAYVKGAIYFDTTLNKLRVGGATAWETVTSI